MNAYNSAKQQNIRCIASALKFLLYGSMEWNMEENFSMEWNMEENFGMEWNMEWKIFGMEWKWNGRKLPVWNMEKSSSIPFHTMPCLRSTISIELIMTESVTSLSVLKKKQFAIHRKKKERRLRWYYRD